MWRSVVGFSALVAASTAPDGYPSRANVFDLNNLLRQHTEFSANSKFKWTTNLPKNLKNDVIFGNNIIGEVHAGLTESSDDSDEHGHEVKSEKFVLTPSSQVQLLDNEIYIPGDTYTRLVVCSYFSNHDECFQSARDGDRGKNDKLEIYPYKKRSPIERLFIGKRHNQNLSVSVRAGEFVATIPLVNISHTSTKVDGEIFSRSVRYKALDYPLFLVRGTGAGDVASVDVIMNASDKIESSAAGQTLSAVVAATSLVSSPPALLTKLTADSNRAVATAIDQAISSLFATSIDEKQTEDQKIANWRVVEVSLKMPRIEGGWNHRVPHVSMIANSVYDRDLDFKNIGTWHLFFDRPRVSAFASVTVDCQKEDEEKIDSINFRQKCARSVKLSQSLAINEVSLRYGDVLSFPVIPNKDHSITIEKHLRQQDWWTPAVGGITVNGKDLNSVAADALCRKIRDEMADLGFNSLDQSLIVAAVKSSSMVSALQATAMNTSFCEI